MTTEGPRGGNGATKPAAIKAMGLYRKVDRIHGELAALGYDQEDPLEVETLSRFDQYHYRGVEAVKEAIETLELGPESRVLEVGAGIGGPARAMAHLADCRVTALELQPDLSETGADLTRRCGLDGRVTHLCGNILTQILEAGSFDAVTSFLVFLHIAKRRALLGRCRDALRPRGVLYIEDYYQLGLLNEAEWRELSEKVYCTYLPTWREYIDQLHRAGFVAIDMQDMTEPWTDFVAERLESFRADRARQIDLHGRETVTGLDDFYSAVVELFRGGRLGGVRIVARRL